MLEVLFKIVILSFDYNKGHSGVWLIDKKIPQCYCLPNKMESSVLDFITDKLGVDGKWIRPRQFTTIFDENNIYISYVGMCPSDISPKIGELVFNYENNTLSKTDQILIEKGIKWI